MPEFVNTPEQNDNVLITIISLCELSFTSGAGSGCPARRAALVCYIRSCKGFPTSWHQGSSFCRGLSFETTFFFFFFNHMTPIKLKGEQRNRHKDVPLLNRGQNVFNQLLWQKGNESNHHRRLTSSGTRCVCSYWALSPKTERIASNAATFKDKFFVFALTRLEN